jgi:hypothetical protein
MADDKKHIDEGWKEEARREKDRLASEEALKGEEAPSPEESLGGRGLPEPSLDLLVLSLAIQARIAMGEIANPVTRKQELDLESAKHAIDLLGILEEKTKGNLTDDEKAHIESSLYELRMRYVQVMQAGM